MTDQEGQISCTNSPVTCETHFAVQGVIGSVGDQEEYRKRKSREHRGAMSWNVPFADIGKSDYKRHRAHCIEESVQGRKEKQARCVILRWRMHIDQPQQKQRGYNADSDNGCDWCPAGSFGSLHQSSFL